MPPGEPDPRSELAVLVLLFAGALLALGFVVGLRARPARPPDAAPRRRRSGSRCSAIAAALILTGKRLVVTEELEERYPPLEHPEEQQAVVQTLEESGSRITRRRLFGLGLAASGGSLGAGAAGARWPRSARCSTWSPCTTRPGGAAAAWSTRTAGRYRAADIEQDALYTAFPEGVDREELAAPVIVVRLAPGGARAAGDIARYAADGIVAYSKICTHAGCAISLYRTPLFPPAEPKPALVCPCHYSTFDPATRRHGAVRPGRPQAADAAAGDRPARRAAGRRQLRRAGRRVLVGRAAAEAELVIRRLVRCVDQRIGTAPLVRKQLRYLFPDHWSFLLGEVALYASSSSC